MLLQSAQGLRNLSQLRLIGDGCFESRIELVVVDQHREDSLGLGPGVEAAVGEKGRGRPKDELGRVFVVLRVGIVVEQIRAS